MVSFVAKGSFFKNHLPDENLQQGHGLYLVFGQLYLKGIKTFKFLFVAHAIDKRNGDFLSVKVLIKIKNIHLNG